MPKGNDSKNSEEQQEPSPEADKAKGKPTDGKAKKFAPEPTTLVVGDLVLDLLSRRVTRGGVALDLRPREFALLEFLMRNVDRVVSTSRASCK